MAELASAGRWMGLDLLNQEMLSSPTTRERVERLAARGMPWQFGVDDSAAWLAPLGGEAEVSPYAEIGRRYGRWPVPLPPATMPAGALPRARLVVARRAA